MILQAGDVVHLVMPGRVDEQAEEALRAFYTSYGIHVNLVSWVSTATSIEVVAVIRGYKGSFQPLKS